MENNNIVEFDLVRYLRLLVKNKFIILIFLVAGVLFASVVIYFTPKIYQAKTIIELGNIGQDGNRLINEIKYSNLSQQYPSLKAIILADKIIEVENYSVKKDEAEKGIADVLKVTLPDNDIIKNNFQSRINSLTTKIDKLIGAGQQIAVIYLKPFDLQEQLDNFVPTKIIQQPTTLKKTLNPFIILLMGSILGLFIGMVYISIKEWWQKNKESIL